MHYPQMLFAVQKTSTKKYGLFTFIFFFTLDLALWKVCVQLFNVCLEVYLLPRGSICHLFYLSLTFLIFHSPFSFCDEGLRNKRAHSLSARICIPIHPLLLPSSQISDQASLQLFSFCYELTCLLTDTLVKCDKLPGEIYFCILTFASTEHFLPSPV